MAFVKRGFVVNSDPNFCSLVLVNRGVTISEDGTRAVVQVTLYGPAMYLSCELDGEFSFTCKFCCNMELKACTKECLKFLLCP